MRGESRKAQRFAVQLPCQFLNNTNKLDGTVLNLSAQGCAMTAEQPPAVSTYVSLDIDLLNGGGAVNIELAGVRWVSGHRCGLEFIRIRHDTLVQLRAFVFMLERTP